MSKHIRWTKEMFAVLNHFGSRKGNWNEKWTICANTINKQFGTQKTPTACKRAYYQGYSERRTGRPAIWDFSTLEVGSFVLVDRSLNVYSMTKAAYRQGRELGRQFQKRTTVQNGERVVRIWRIA